MSDLDLKSNYAKAGYHNRLGYGERPALLMIDFAKAYFEVNSPLFANVEDVRVAAIELATKARQRNIPVIVTRVLFRKGGLDGGMFFRKVPALKCFEVGNPLGEWAEGIEPRESDIIVTKQYASAYHCTSLFATLTSLRVDTVILTGLTTSGCVRATCVDAVSSGFRPIIVREAVGDRHSGPHEANLLDMDAKYGDVEAISDVAEYLSRCAADRS